MIRLGNEEDIPELVFLGKMMHGEAPHYQGVPYKEGDAALFIKNCLNQEEKVIFIAEDGGAIIGMMIGMIVPYMFNFEAGYASDMVFYVAPAWRGSKAGAALLLNFEAWARCRTKTIKLGESSGIMPEKYKEFLSKMGYTQSGTVYSKEI